MQVYVTSETAKGSLAGWWLGDRGRNSSRQSGVAAGWLESWFAVGLDIEMSNRVWGRGRVTCFSTTLPLAVLGDSDRGESQWAREEDRAVSSYSTRYHSTRTN
jgi:hypothetical protein